MRELTKSLFSFSWAMSLFGVQQTANLMSPAKVVKAFESVTEATRTQFGDAIESTFDAGDKLQRGAVDMALSPLTGDALNPSRWIRLGSDVVKQTTEAVTKGVQGATSAARQATPQGSGTGTGWGPIPS